MNVAIAWCSLLVMLSACERERRAPGAPERASRPPHPTECRVDDDCTLMPAAITCCGECDPAPPFEPVPRTAVDAVLIELETTCAEHPEPCDPPVCERVPPGCEADAICIGGRCSVVQSGSCSGYLVARDRLNDANGPVAACPVGRASRAR